MKIQIKNWDKYNPKRAQKTYTWLRLGNDIYSEPKLHGENEAVKWIYICLLCLASKQNDGNLEFELDWLAYEIRSDVKKISKALETLKEKGLLHYTTPTLHQTTPTLQSTTPTDGRTNETRRDETNTVKRPPATPAEIFNLPKIYAIYPRKIGKGEGLKILAKDIKTADDYAACLRAVENYAVEVADSEEKFIKHFPTWCRRWRDWVEHKPAGRKLATNEAQIREIMGEE